jgi:hypothetical protein
VSIVLPDGEREDPGEVAMQSADPRVHPEELLEVQRRGVNWSQVAEPRIGPRTKRHPPSASGGNMYLQRSQRSSAWRAGR